MRTKKNFTGYYIKRCAAIVIPIVFGIWWIFGDDWRASNSQLGHTQEWIRSMPGYQSHSAYLDELLERHHDYAFPRTYRGGTRGSAATFDKDRYVYVVLNRMANEAQGAGRQKIADNLRRIYSTH